jgi:hypothetical protein
MQLMLYSVAGFTCSDHSGFVQPGVQLISERDDQYIPACRQAGSSASIAENPILAAYQTFLFISSYFSFSSIVLKFSTSCFEKSARANTAIPSVICDFTVTTCKSRLSIIKASLFAIATRVA